VLPGALYSVGVHDIDLSRLRILVFLPERVLM